MPNHNVSIISPQMACSLQAFISTEETRYYLQGFLIEKHPVAGAYLVSTNGHLLGIFHDAAAHVAAAGAIVKLSKDFLKACNGWKSSIPAAVYIDHDSGMAYLAARLNLDDGDVMPADLSKLPMCETIQPKCLIADASFPDWARVCPKPPTTAQTAYATYNPANLTAFASVFTAAERRMFSADNAPSIGISGTDENSPAWVFIPKHPEFMGVLMPVRSKGDTPVLPAWLFQKPAKPQLQAVG